MEEHAASRLEHQDRAGEGNHAGVLEPTTASKDPSTNFIR